MKTILVMERSNFSRDYMGRIIEHLGYSAIGVADGESGLKTLASGGINAAIIGEGLSDYNSIDLFRVIRKNDTKEHVPVIVVSSNPNAAYRTEALAAGIDSFITRPLSIRSFFDALEGCLSQNRRKKIRSPMTFPVKVSCGDDEYDLMTQDFGEGGMFLLSSDPLPEDSMLTLGFSLPGLTSAFSTVGKVMHRSAGKEGSNPSGMGVMFTELGGAQQSFLSVYMENHLARGNPNLTLQSA